MLQIGSVLGVDFPSAVSDFSPGNARNISLERVYFAQTQNFTRLCDVSVPGLHKYWRGAEAEVQGLQGG